MHTTEAMKSTTENQKYESSIQRALAWLITQRESNWGWRNDTPKVLTALQLAPQEESASLLPPPLEMQLSVKQLEVEIVILLWR
ncbi:hypothetical protein NQ314_005904 [Rhamnusium bicolor]|uniref:Uncharacterized protein n=1 Tax=Rhamnusium bicolor TaxID=1586634 RepID=A0AAV8ZBN3_9CUCU|nr:hypothetical protein NQ314_005904 [Rhamnusium bicolor]